MIFAAGLGTRLKPLTDYKPKALVEIKGKPILEHLINRMKKFGFNEFVINVHHFANQIVDFLEKNRNFGSDIDISDETDELLDTGGGILKAEKFLNNEDSFLIYNVDIYSDINPHEIIEFHKQNKALATLSVKQADSARKLFFDSQNQLCEWKNTKTGEIKTARIPTGEMQGLAFNGIHVVNPEIFKYITETGKFSIIDLYLRLAETKKISAFQSSYQFWFDLGKPENIVQAEKLTDNQ